MCHTKKKLSPARYKVSANLVAFSLFRHKKAMTAAKVSCPIEAHTKYSGWAFTKWAFSEILGSWSQEGILSTKSIYHCQKEILSST